jgi:hypothetical protein
VRRRALPLRDGNGGFVEVDGDRKFGQGLLDNRAHLAPAQAAVAAAQRGHGYGSDVVRSNNSLQVFEAFGDILDARVLFPVLF